jgi:hypothetical protein
VYLDEAWIFENGTVARCWHDNNPESIRKLKVDGKRLFVLIVYNMTMFNCFRFIALHAGNSTGLGHLWYFRQIQTILITMAKQIRIFFGKFGIGKLENIDNIVKELYASIIMQ